MIQAEQVVDDLEALRPLGIVDAADVDELLEPAVRIVAQEGEHADDRLAPRHDRELVGAISVRAARSPSAGRAAESSRELFEPAMIA